MLAYLLAYTLMFCVFTTPWKFVLVSVCSYFFSPREERPRLFASFLLAFFFFIILLSPQLKESSLKDYYENRKQSFQAAEPIRTYMQEKDSLLSEDAKIMYDSLIMGKLDSYSDFGALVKEHGILHLFVVSGFHFTILFVLISFLLHKILKMPYKLSLLVILILASIYYMVLQGGFGATRAYFTIVLGILAFFLGRSTDSENILFTISLFWILIFPISIYSLGFQLSFVATYLLILAGKILFVKSMENRVVKDIVLSLLVSIGVSSFLFLKGKSLVLLSFLIVALSAPVISLLLVLMFLLAILPMHTYILSDVLIYVINYIAGIYHNFLLTFQNLSTLKVSLPVDIALAIQAGIIYLFFSRKFLSYNWESKKILILFFILIFCFIV